MNINKEQKIGMYLKKLAWYSTYVDCFSRIINEFIENGEDNLKPNDIPNLMELNMKFAYRLNRIITEMKSDWEFLYISLLSVGQDPCYKLFFPFPAGEDRIQGEFRAVEFLVRVEAIK